MVARFPKKIYLYLIQIFQLRNVSFDSRGGDRLLEGVTFEARGGDLVAIMATKREVQTFKYFCIFYLSGNSMTESEGTALCDLLSDSYRSWRHRASGEIVLNGVAVSTQRMRDRVAYARRQVNK